ncbi:hypothetical protein V8F20_001654 [Naviculisporaceae sp. PSN 640]
MDMDMDMDTTTTTTTTTRITTTTSSLHPHTASSSSGPSSTSSPPSKLPILVLGGTGTVGSRIAAQLAADSYPVVIASRSAPNSPTPSASASSSSTSPNKTNDSNPDTEKNIHRVYFNWEDRSTWQNPFKYISALAQAAQISAEIDDEEKKVPDISPYSTTEAERKAMYQEKAQQERENAQKWKDWRIGAVYLIAPPGVLDAANVMMDFVDFARRQPGSELGSESAAGGELGLGAGEAAGGLATATEDTVMMGNGGGGVRRFVLQSASCIEPGGPAMGKVHGYFRELGSRGEIEWAVLRPSWFQQNFGVQENHVQSIRNEGKIYSATGDGKIPWISADDIAAVAVQALTMPVAPNTEFLVLGPELLSYDDIARTLSEVLGKKIVHVDLTSGDLERRHRSFGMPEDYSSMMSALDTGIKYGMENRTNDVVLSVTGVAPKTFKEYAESVKHVWQPVDVAPTKPVEVVLINA